MKEKISWLYNEFAQVGKNYARMEEAAVFEARHSEFRDLEGESRAVLDALALGSEQVLVDFGCGTGIFAIAAAQRCRKVHAVDVSQAMLDYARNKAEKNGVANVAFHHDGFLTFVADEPVDFVTSSLALHHLPDFWKDVAVKRLYEMLKPGGVFYLHDVVFAREGAFDNIGALLDRLETAGGQEMRRDVEEHLRLEFSTYDWVMEGFLVRAGFRIERQEIVDGVLGTYFCRRPPGLN